MSKGKSKIEWTDASWNPTRGCSRVSAGCDNCYAMRQARRQDRPGGAYEGLTTIRKGEVDWSGKVVALPNENGGVLTAPMRWMGSQRIFVNSMSDLFHESLEDWQIDRIFGVMWACLYDRHGTAGHMFQILTKRAKRMQKYMTGTNLPERWARMAAMVSEDGDAIYDQTYQAASKRPHPRIHLGVSVEYQQYADERIPYLLGTPAAVRFVSAEPLLGPVDLWAFIDSPLRNKSLAALRANEPHPIPRMPGLDWVIVGGESGHGARFYNVDWARNLIAQCKEAGCKVFHKQLGARPWEDKPVMQNGGRWGAPCGENLIKLRSRKGGDMAEWPADLRVREMP